MEIDNSNEKNEISIKIRTVDKEFQLTINPEEKIEKLKKEIEILAKVPTNKQRLIFRGKLLKNEETISQCKITNMDVIHLVAKIGDNIIPKENLLNNNSNGENAQNSNINNPNSSNNNNSSSSSGDNFNNILFNLFTPFNIPTSTSNSNSSSNNTRVNSTQNASASNANNNSPGQNQANVNTNNTSSAQDSGNIFFISQSSRSSNRNPSPPTFNYNARRRLRNNMKESNINLPECKEAILQNILSINQIIDYNLNYQKEPEKNKLNNISIFKTEKNLNQMEIVDSNIQSVPNNTQNEPSPNTNTNDNQTVQQSNNPQPNQIQEKQEEYDDDTCYDFNHRKFEVGQWIDAKDTIDQWLEAQIIDIKEDKSEVFIHYNGWGFGWDEWIPMNSKRIMPFRYHTRQKTFSDYCSPFPNTKPDSNNNVSLSFPEGTKNTIQNRNNNNSNNSSSENFIDDLHNSNQMHNDIQSYEKILINKKKSDNQYISMVQNKKDAEFLDVFYELEKINKIIFDNIHSLLNKENINYTNINDKIKSQVDSFSLLKKMVPIIDRTGKLYSDISSYINQLLSKNQLNELSKKLFNNYDNDNELLKPFNDEESRKAAMDLLSKCSQRELNNQTIHFIPPINKYEIQENYQYLMPNIDTPKNILTVYYQNIAQMQRPPILDIVLHHNVFDNRTNNVNEAVSNPPNPTNQPNNQPNPPNVSAPSTTTNNNNNNNNVVGTSSSSGVKTSTIGTNTEDLNNDSQHNINAAKNNNSNTVQNCGDSKIIQKDTNVSKELIGSKKDENINININNEIKGVNEDVEMNSLFSNIKDNKQISLNSNSLNDINLCDSINDENINKNILSTPNTMINQLNSMELVNENELLGKKRKSEDSESVKDDSSLSAINNINDINNIQDNNKFKDKEKEKDNLNKNQNK